MNTEKLRKISGIILLIKSFIILVATLISGFIGISLIIDAKRITDNAQNSTEQAVNCSGLAAAIGWVLGYIFIVSALLLIILFIVYFINSRKILYSPTYPKGSVICMIIFEIISISSSFSLFFSYLQSSDKSGIIILLGIILLIQSTITLILLIKLHSQSKKNENSNLPINFTDKS